MSPARSATAPIASHNYQQEIPSVPAGNLAEEAGRIPYVLPKTDLLAAMAGHQRSTQMSKNLKLLIERFFFYLMFAGAVMLLASLFVLPPPIQILSRFPKDVQGNIVLLLFFISAAELVYGAIRYRLASKTPH